MKFKIDLTKNNTDQIKWLEIEADDLGTNGAFLYYCKTENDCFDTWHKTIDDAFLSAQEQYGIKKEDWVLVW